MDNRYDYIKKLAEDTNGCVYLPVRILRKIYGEVAVMKDSIEVKKFVEYAKLPEKAHDGDLGYDLFSAESVEIIPGQTKLIGTGIGLKFPDGYGCFVKDRSGLAVRERLSVSAGVIDAGYTGEIKVVIRNNGNLLVSIKAGQKIAQAVPIQVTSFDVVEVDDFSSTTRGNAGFGSTGV